MHVNDVANLVKTISINKPEQKYLLAVDGTIYSKDKFSNTQQNIIKSISEGIGTGNIKNIELKDLEKNDETLAFNIDLQLIPSHLMEY